MYQPGISKAILKAIVEQENKYMNINNKSKTAISKYIRVSPNKVRRILNQIRGKKYTEAILILDFIPYRASKCIKKTINSAVANTISKHGYNKNNLIINNAFADQGPTLKRFKARAQGRAFPILKPTCHITIKLDHL